MTNTTPTPGALDLPQHRIDYIARQYFADEQYQVHVKHAIHDAFQEARRAAQPSAEKAEGELPPPDVIGYTCIGENDAYSPALVKKIVRDAIAASRRAAGGEVLDERHAVAETACSDCSLTVGQSWMLHDIERGAVRLVRATPAPERAAQAGQVAWTEERITELSKNIAIAVARNASTVPQLCFPHVYLGLKEALATPERAAAPGEGTMEQAMDATYPRPDSPHASVNEYATIKRNAFQRGWHAAIATQQAGAQEGSAA